MTKPTKTFFVSILAAAVLAACGGGEATPPVGGTVVNPPGTGGTVTPPVVTPGPDATTPMELTATGAALGGILQTRGMDYAEVTVPADSNGFTTKIVINPDVYILTSPSLISKDVSGPVMLVEIASGVVVVNSPAPTTVSGTATKAKLMSDVSLSGSGATSTNFGSQFGGAGKILISTRVSDTQPSISGAQEWSCASTGSTRTTPDMKDGGNYTSDGTATFGLSANAVEWRPRVTGRWSKTSRLLNNVQTFQLGVLAAPVEVGAAVQVITMSPVKADKHRDVSMSWGYRQYAELPNSTMIFAITTFDCKKISETVVTPPPVVAPPVVTPPPVVAPPPVVTPPPVVVPPPPVKGPPPPVVTPPGVPPVVTPPVVTPPVVTPPVVTPPVVTSPVVTPPAVAGNTMTIRGGVGGLPNYMGLAQDYRPKQGAVGTPEYDCKPPLLVWSNGGCFTTPVASQFPSLMITIPGAGTSFSDYVDTYNGDTWAVAGNGLEFLNKVVDDNWQKDGLPQGTLVSNFAPKIYTAGKTASIAVGALKSGQFVQSAGGNYTLTSFAWGRGPGVVYAVSDIKSPTSALSYACAAPDVVEVRLGTGALSLLTAPVATGGGVLTLSGSSTGQFFQNKLRVQFQPNLTVEGYAIRGAFDSTPMARDFLSTPHQYEGWDAAPLEKLGYMVVPGEEDADTKTRYVAILFKQVVPQSNQVLHGGLVLTCTR